MAKIIDFRTKREIRSEVPPPPIEQRLVIAAKNCNPTIRGRNEMVTSLARITAACREVGNDKTSDYPQVMQSFCLQVLVEVEACIFRLGGPA